MCVVQSKLSYQLFDNQPYCFHAGRVMDKLWFIMADYGLMVCCWTRRVGALLATARCETLPIQLANQTNQLTYQTPQTIVPTYPNN